MQTVGYYLNEDQRRKLLRMLNQSDGIYGAGNVLKETSDVLTPYAWVKITDATLGASLGTFVTFDKVGAVSSWQDCELIDSPNGEALIVDHYYFTDSRLR